MTRADNFAAGLSAVFYFSLFLMRGECHKPWAGLLCLSRNSVPAFGEVADGVISACCENGLGTTKSTLAGIAAAEKILEQPGDALRGMLAYDAPKHLPPEPLAWLGINSYLRYKEWKAGLEL